MSSISLYFKDNLNSIHLDFRVFDIFFSELLIKINNTFSFGSSIDLSKAFVECIFKYSISLL